MIDNLKVVWDLKIILFRVYYKTYIEIKYKDNIASFKYTKEWLTQKSIWR